MSTYRVQLARMETYAWVTVEAADEDAAAEMACSDAVRNNADWRVSEGNYIRHDDVSVIEIEAA